MPTPFLLKCAEVFVEKHQKQNFPNLCVVLPSRRGVYYFKKHLTALVNGAFVSPNIVSIEDFIIEISGLELAQPVQLLLELYKSAKVVDNSTSFEHFISWAPIILKDFELLDQYLVDSDQLFAYMTEAKAIERWDLTQTEQQNLSKSKSVDQYFELFKTLNAIYKQFNLSLSTQKISYRGSAYRFASQNIESLILENPGFEHYYFLGFNALSVAEEKLIFAMQNAKIATCIWDTDQYYMGNNAIGNMAGKFLKDYKIKSSAFGPWLWMGNELIDSTKNIKMVECANASEQALVAKHYLNQWFVPNESTIETALVLSDENLLNTVLPHIPAQIENVNFTMGIGIKNSAVFQFVQAIFKLQLQIKTNKTNVALLNTRLVLDVLQNSITQFYWQAYGENCQELILNLQRQERLFVPSATLQNGKANRKMVFESWEDNPNIALQNIGEILHSLKNIPAELIPVSELLFLAEFDKIIGEAKRLMATHTEIQNLQTLHSLLNELLKSVRIPFESDIDSNLQIMGMLESRTLDYKRIIVLSANESILPSSKLNNSLIPFDALHGFGMPTYSHQDAIMSYHFYRLLQYAKEVVFCYTSPKAGYSGFEKSRFLTQIETQLVKYNSNITVENLKSNFGVISNIKSAEMRVDKSPEIVETIENWLITKGLSATSLNSYLNCKMKFYLERIAKLENFDEPSQVMGADKFGELVHSSLQYIFESFGKSFDKIDLQRALSQIDSTLKTALEALNLKQHYAINIEEGQNLLLFEVAKTIITEYLKYEISSINTPKSNLAIEQSFYTELPVLHKGKALNIKLMAKCDRLEQEEDIIKVIDYKTGKVEKKEVDFIKAEKTDLPLQLERLKTVGSDKIRQLWFYKYVLDKQYNDFGFLQTEMGAKITNRGKIQPGIYSFRNLKSGFLQGFTAFAGEENFLDISENLLKEIVSEILDINQAFYRTDELTHCVYCNFKTSCGRNQG